ncbi:MAG: hypothetical protein JF887_11485 [Candidatus Dormibacteraeota bacterium]|uniref:Uncharacterized protein n=1 Tax=Candidatus Amunia macphersoniae TaxID=3127014 RepID=A0A934KGB7_9BACT|nr:hypothetical protein [Candidatus Dormibacteraeota bacterium]
MKAAPDIRTAEWVVTGLRGFAESVLSIVPCGFPAYVRVFHPAYRRVGATSARVRWQDVAAANQTHAHAGMQLNALTGSYHFINHAQPGIFDQPPFVGALPNELFAQLAVALARHTSTPERCWFSIWTGFGAIPSDVRAAPTFSTREREYHLLAASAADAVEDVRKMSTLPPINLWWPDDRAWCVATEIDLNTTYVGCDDATRDEILVLPRVEDLAIDPQTGIGWDSDHLNPLV